MQCRVTPSTKEYNKQLIKKSWNKRYYKTHPERYKAEQQELGG